MRPTTIQLTILLILLAACAAPTAKPTTTPTLAAPPTAALPTATLTPLLAVRVAHAQAFVDTLVAGEYAAATADFDDTMLSLLPAEQLQQAWEQTVAAVGAYQHTVRTRAEHSGDFDMVYVTCQFASAPVDVKVVYDGNGKISGLWFQPAQLYATPAYTPPDYADPASFSESDITIGSGEWALPGTLTLPHGDGPFPAVVLVHGSGPNDRDETIASNKPFQDLAWGLASRGIAVLRYDKRTYVHAQKFTPDILNGLTLNEETVDDALLAVERLRSLDSIDAQRIYVIGHSLGAMAAPRIAERDRQLAGIILLAAPARPFEDVYLAQLHYLANLDGKLSDAEVQSLAEEAAKAERVKDPAIPAETDPELLPLGIPVNYWIDLGSYNPVETAAALDTPMLILQGERDYQVTVDDFALWEKAFSGVERVTLKLYPGLNHLFMAGEGPGNPQEYTLPAHLAEEVIADIAAWITH